MASRDFLPLIRQLEGQMTLPVSDRIRILRELEGDLESMRDAFLAAGLTPAEAVDRAREALAPDPITLQRLGVLHQPRYHQVTRGLAADRLRLLERSVLAACTGAIILAAIAMLARADLLASPSAFLIPMLGLGALMAAAILSLAFRMWIRFDDDIEVGLSPVLAVGLAALGLGFFGALVDLYRLASTLSANPANDLVLATRWVVQDAALIAVSIVIALAGGLTWFVSTQWLRLVRSERVQFLDLKSSQPLIKEF